MSRRAAAVTQADVARIVRGARQAGAQRVTVKVGTAEIVIDLSDTGSLPPPAPVDVKQRINL